MFGASRFLPLVILAVCGVFAPSAIGAVSVNCTHPTGPGEVGVAYSGTCVASGGTGPYTYVISGEPTGVTIGLNSGLVTGPATASGNFAAVTVTATDAGASGTGNFNYPTWTVAPAVAFACTNNGV